MNKSRLMVALGIVMISAFIFSSCLKQESDESKTEQVSQSELILVSDNSQYISWDDNELKESIKYWESNPSLYEVVGMLLHSRKEKRGVSLEQVINDLHDEYEKKGVMSSYMAVFIEAMGTDISMFHKDTFELNIAVNPDSDRVALNALNIYPKEGYKYDDLKGMVDKYLGGEIDGPELDEFLSEMEMMLVIKDSEYDRLYVFKATFHETGVSEKEKIVKCVIDSRVEEVYLQILK